VNLIIVSNLIQRPSTLIISTFTTFRQSNTNLHR